MRYYLLLIIAFVLAPTASLADIHVFACEPEWAALAEELGGEHVTTTSATSAQEDPHHVRAKPSLLAAMRQADLVACSGASLEIGWLPILLQKAGKPSVQSGKEGFINLSDYVTRLEVPTSLDRSDGDIHPEGNPHIHLDPRNILRVAPELSARLQAVDPANAAFYAQRLTDFSARWKKAMARWEADGAKLRGMPIIVHHQGWTYLVQWLGLKEIGELEAKPGIPPSTAHLESLLSLVKTTPVSAIVRTPYDAPDASEWLAKKAQTTALILPYTVGGDAQSGDLFALFDRTLALLKQAHHAQ